MDLRRIENYRGHKIAAQAHEDQPGSWGWSFLVDDIISSVNKIRFLPNAETALREAVLIARAQIDDMGRGE